MKRHYLDNSDGLSYDDLTNKISHQITVIESISNHAPTYHTHTENEFGHLHPELKNKQHMNKRQLNKFENHRSINKPYTQPNYKSQLSSENYKTLLTGHLLPDVSLFDQGSDATYTCRLDLLTNVRQLHTPERFSTISGDAKSSLVRTMHLNLGYQNGTISWIEKEAYYSPHYTSTILSKKLLEEYNLYLFCKPPYRATFHNSHNRKLVYDVPFINGKLLFKLSVNPIYNVLNLEYEESVINPMAYTNRTPTRTGNPQPVEKTLQHHISSQPKDKL
ncbi:hypothetical protein E3Q16_04416 [Wallemia mellicola]|nr:hypothetical protein E3Q16_04416 [Wallemia mellicola]